MKAGVAVTTIVGTYIITKLILLCFATIVTSTVSSGPIMNEIVDIEFCPVS
jgi:hypothetical protein